VLEPGTLPRSILPATPAPATAAPDAGVEMPPLGDLYEEIRQLERRRIAEALEAASGVQVKAAELIGMPLRTFAGKVRLYGLLRK
jgi:transcriptional regulator with GAF, ATPase, and Fis domain